MFVYLDTSRSPKLPLIASVETTLSWKGSFSETHFHSSMKVFTVWHLLTPIGFTQLNLAAIHCQFTLPEFNIFWICFIFQTFSFFSVLWHGVCNSPGTISASWFNFLIQTRPMSQTSSGTSKNYGCNPKDSYVLKIYFPNVYIAPNNLNYIFMLKMIHTHFIVLCSDTFGNDIWQCFNQEEQNSEKNKGWSLGQNTVLLTQNFLGFQKQNPPEKVQ